MRIACLSLFLAVASFAAIGSAKAEQITLYSFDKVPDISGIVAKNGEMYAAFGGADGGDGALNTFSKLLKLDQSGKTRCTSLHVVDIGTGWDVNPCLSTKYADEGRDAYVIDAVIKFDHLVDDDILQILKDHDFVKERRFTLLFSPGRWNCKVTIVKRTYVPLDGDKQVASRTGPGVCTVKAQNR